MRLEVTLRALQNALQICEVNWGPLSHTMSWGMPCSQKMWEISRLVVSKVEGSLGRGTKWTALENRSTMIRIPWEGGRPVTKSMVTTTRGVEEWARTVGGPQGDDGGICSRHKQYTQRSRSGHLLPWMATRSAAVRGQVCDGLLGGK